MPTARINGAKLHYEERGRGPEIVVFQHGVLMDSRMFDAQVEKLSARYRCITYDTRGHGRSEVTPDGYDMQSLARDAAGLIRSLDCAPCHLVGVNVGGCVALNVAILEPTLLRSLAVLHASASRATRREALEFRGIAALVRIFGMRPFAGWLMRMAFAREFLDDPARRQERDRWRQQLATFDKVAAYRLVSALRDWDWVKRLPEIRIPTLVVTGSNDPETEQVAARISGAILQRLPTTGFASPIERPADVTRLLDAFIGEVAARQAVRRPTEIRGEPPLQ